MSIQPCKNYFYSITFFSPLLRFVWKWRRMGRKREEIGLVWQFSLFGWHCRKEMKIKSLFRYCLLLKTENWKHCNKIIFKCVNSIVGPNFKVFFLLNKVLTGPMNNAHDPLKNAQYSWKHFLALSKCKQSGKSEHPSGPSFLICPNWGNEKKDK